jgi:hypothetical protein
LSIQNGYSNAIAGETPARGEARDAYGLEVHFPSVRVFLSMA